MRFYMTHATRNPKELRRDVLLFNEPTLPTHRNTLPSNTTTASQNDHTAESTSDSVQAHHKREEYTTGILSYKMKAFPSCVFPICVNMSSC